VLINSIVINVGNAIPFSRVHDNVQNITKENFFNGCENCHSKDRINPEEYAIEGSPLDNNFSSSLKDALYSENVQPANNYTILLEVGQTPYQIIPFLRYDGWTGYSWWDTASSYDGEFSFGTEIQKKPDFIDGTGK